MRQLSVGTVSNDDFESDILDDVSHSWLPEQYYRSTYAKTDDPVVVPILEACWGLYDILFDESILFLVSLFVRNGPKVSR
jgi:hypothetical protein